MTKNKLWQAIKGLTLAAGMAVGIFALGQTDVLADTLTLTVEKNTIGQGMILDPVQVEFAKGETCADVLLRGLSENGITPLYDTNTSYGFYLRGIANCDSGSLNPPACIQKVLSETSTWTGDAYKLTDNKYAPENPLTWDHLERSAFAFPIMRISSLLSAASKICLLLLYGSHPVMSVPPQRANITRRTLPSDG